MSRALALAAAAALLALLVAPTPAEACSVCFSTTEENQWAFIATTIFLSVLPLATLLGIGAWLRGKVVDMERRHEEARSAAPPQG